MIIDVNVLLYAVEASSPHHQVAHTWFEEAMNGDVRAGFPWHSLVGFVRIATHPKIFTAPMTGREAWAYVDEWLDHDMAWIPLPTDPASPGSRPARRRPLCDRESGARGTPRGSGDRTRCGCVFVRHRFRAVPRGGVDQSTAPVITVPRVAAAAITTPDTTCRGTSSGPEPASSAAASATPGIPNTSIALPDVLGTWTFAS